MSKIGILPTTKTLFWSEKLKKEWAPKIRRVGNAYRKAELNTFLQGMRRVYVYHVNSERFDETYDFLRENQLAFFPTNKSGLYSGFSHKHLPIIKGKPYTLYGGVVRNDDLKAGELFKEYSLSTPVNHVGIGGLLSYPEDCLKFFSETWGKASIDPMYEAAIRTEGAKIKDRVAIVKAHPYANNMLRYFGIRITPHLTCSLRCKASIKWGKKWFKVMSEIDAQAAEWAKELLSMPLTWSCYRGVVVIDTPIFRGVSNSDSAPIRKIVENTGWK